MLGRPLPLHWSEILRSITMIILVIKLCDFPYLFLILYLNHPSISPSKSHRSSKLNLSDLDLGQVSLAHAASGAASGIPGFDDFGGGALSWQELGIQPVFGVAEPSGGKGSKKSSKKHPAGTDANATVVVPEIVPQPTRPTKLSDVMLISIPSTGDDTLNHIFGRLAKRDPITKLKTLDALKQYIQSAYPAGALASTPAGKDAASAIEEGKSAQSACSSNSRLSAQEVQENISHALPIIIQYALRLSFDNDAKVREAVYSCILAPLLAHGSSASCEADIRAGRFDGFVLPEVAQSLLEMIPESLSVTWLMHMNDSAREVARTARSEFERCFGSLLSQTRRPNSSTRSAETKLDTTPEDEPQFVVAESAGTLTQPTQAAEHLHSARSDFFATSRHFIIGSAIELLSSSPRSLSEMCGAIYEAQQTGQTRAGSDSADPAQDRFLRVFGSVIGAISQFIDEISVLRANGFVAASRDGEFVPLYVAQAVSTAQQHQTEQLPESEETEREKRDKKDKKDKKDKDKEKDKASKVDKGDKAEKRDKKDKKDKKDTQEDGPGTTAKPAKIKYGSKAFELSGTELDTLSASIFAAVNNPSPSVRRHCYQFFIHLIKKESNYLEGDGSISDRLYRLSNDVIFGAVMKEKAVLAQSSAYALLVHWIRRFPRALDLVKSTKPLTQLIASRGNGAAEVFFPYLLPIVKSINPSMCKGATTADRPFLPDDFPMFIVESIWDALGVPLKALQTATHSVLNQGMPIAQAFAPNMYQHLSQDNATQEILVAFIEVTLHILATFAQPLPGLVSKVINNVVVPCVAFFLLVPSTLDQLVLLRSPSTPQSSATSVLGGNMYSRLGAVLASAVRAITAASRDQTSTTQAPATTPEALLNVARDILQLFQVVLKGSATSSTQIVDAVPRQALISRLSHLLRSVRTVLTLKGREQVTTMKVVTEEIVFPLVSSMLTSVMVGGGDLDTIILASGLLQTFQHGDETSATSRTFATNLLHNLILPLIKSLLLSTQKRSKAAQAAIQSSGVLNLTMSRLKLTLSDAYEAECTVNRSSAQSIPALASAVQDHIVSEKLMDFLRILVRMIPLLTRHAEKGAATQVTNYLFDALEETSPLRHTELSPARVKDWLSVAIALVDQLFAANVSYRHCLIVDFEGFDPKHPGWRLGRLVLEALWLLARAPSGDAHEIAKAPEDEDENDGTNPEIMPYLAAFIRKSIIAPPLDLSSPTWANGALVPPFVLAQVTRVLATGLRSYTELEQNPQYRSSTRQPLWVSLPNIRAAVDEAVAVARAKYRAERSVSGEVSESGDEKEDDSDEDEPENDESESFLEDFDGIGDGCEGNVPVSMYKVSQTLFHPACAPILTTHLPSSLTQIDQDTQNLIPGLSSLLATLSSSFSNQRHQEQVYFWRLVKAGAMDNARLGDSMGGANEVAIPLVPFATTHLVRRALLASRALRHTRIKLSELQLRSQTREDDEDDEDSDLMRDERRLEMRLVKAQAVLETLGEITKSLASLAPLFAVSTLPASSALQVAISGISTPLDAEPTGFALEALPYFASLAAPLLFTVWAEVINSQSLSNVAPISHRLYSPLEAPFADSKPKPQQESKDTKLQDALDLARKRDVSQLMTGFFLLQNSAYDPLRFWSRWFLARLTVHSMLYGEGIDPSMVCRILQRIPGLSGYVENVALECDTLAVTNTDTDNTDSVNIAIAQNPRSIACASVQDAHAWTTVGMGCSSDSVSVLTQKMKALQASIEATVQTMEDMPTSSASPSPAAFSEADAPTNLNLAYDSEIRWCELWVNARRSFTHELLGVPQGVTSIFFDSKVASGSPAAIRDGIAHAVLDALDASWDGSQPLGTTDSDSPPTTPVRMPSGPEVFVKQYWIRPCHSSEGASRFSTIPDDDYRRDFTLSDQGSMLRFWDGVKAEPINVTSDRTSNGSGSSTELRLTLGYTPRWTFASLLEVAAYVRQTPLTATLHPTSDLDPLTLLPRIDSDDTEKEEEDSRRFAMHALTNARLRLASLPLHLRIHFLNKLLGGSTQDRSNSNEPDPVKSLWHLLRTSGQLLPAALADLVNASESEYLALIDPTSASDGLGKDSDLFWELSLARGEDDAALGLLDQQRPPLAPNAHEGDLSGASRVSILSSGGVCWTESTKAWAERHSLLSLNWLIASHAQSVFRSSAALIHARGLHEKLRLYHTGDRSKSVIAAESRARNLLAQNELIVRRASHAWSETRPFAQWIPEWINLAAGLLFQYSGVTSYSESKVSSSWVPHPKALSLVIPPRSLLLALNESVANFTSVLSAGTPEATLPRQFTDATYLAAQLERTTRLHFLHRIIVSLMNIIGMDSLLALPGTMVSETSGVMLADALAEEELSSVTDLEGRLVGTEAEVLMCLLNNGKSSIPPDRHSVTLQYGRQTMTTLRYSDDLGLLFVDLLSIENIVGAFTSGNTAGQSGICSVGLDTVTLCNTFGTQQDRSVAPALYAGNTHPHRVLDAYVQSVLNSSGFVLRSAPSNDQLRSNHLRNSISPTLLTSICRAVIGCLRRPDAEKSSSPFISALAAQCEALRSKINLDKLTDIVTTQLCTTASLRTLSQLPFDAPPAPIVDPAVYRKLTGTAVTPTHSQVNESASTTLVESIASDAGSLTTGSRESHSRMGADSVSMLNYAKSLLAPFDGAPPTPTKLRTSATVAASAPQLPEDAISVAAISSILLDSNSSNHGPVSTFDSSLTGTISSAILSAEEKLSSRFSVSGFLYETLDYVGNGPLKSIINEAPLLASVLVQDYKTGMSRTNTPTTLLSLTRMADSSYPNGWHFTAPADAIQRAIAWIHSTIKAQAIVRPTTHSVLLSFIARLSFEVLAAQTTREILKEGSHIPIPLLPRADADDLDSSKSVVQRALLSWLETQPPQIVWLTLMLLETNEPLSISEGVSDEVGQWVLPLSGVHRELAELLMGNGNLDVLSTIRKRASVKMRGSMLGLSQHLTETEATPALLDEAEIWKRIMRATFRSDDIAYSPSHLRAALVYSHATAHIANMKRLRQCLYEALVLYCAAYSVDDPVQKLRLFKAEREEESKRTSQSDELSGGAGESQPGESQLPSGSTVFSRLFSFLQSWVISPTPSVSRSDEISRDEADENIASTTDVTDARVQSAREELAASTSLRRVKQALQQPTISLPAIPIPLPLLTLLKTLLVQLREQSANTTVSQRVLRLRIASALLSLVPAYGVSTSPETKEVMALATLAFQQEQDLLPADANNLELLSAQSALACELLNALIQGSRPARPHPLLSANLLSALLEQASRNFYALRQLRSANNHPISLGFGGIPALMLPLTLPAVKLFTSVLHYARGLPDAQFQEYPVLPKAITTALCELLVFLGQRRVGAPALTSRYSGESHSQLKKLSIILPVDIFIDFQPDPSRSSASEDSYIRLSSTRSRMGFVRKCQTLSGSWSLALVDAASTSPMSEPLESIYGSEASGAQPLTQLSRAIEIANALVCGWDATHGKNIDDALHGSPQVIQGLYLLLSHPCTDLAHAVASVLEQILCRKVLAGPSIAPLDEFINTISAKLASETKRGAQSSSSSYDPSGVSSATSAPRLNGEPSLLNSQRLLQLETQAFDYGASLLSPMPPVDDLASIENQASARIPGASTASGPTQDLRSVLLSARAVPLDTQQSGLESSPEMPVAPVDLHADNLVNQLNSTILRCTLAKVAVVLGEHAHPVMRQLLHTVDPQSLGREGEGRVNFVHITGIEVMASAQAQASRSALSGLLGLPHSNTEAESQTWLQQVSQDIVANPTLWHPEYLMHEKSVLASLATISHFVNPNADGTSNSTSSSTSASINSAGARALHSLARQLWQPSQDLAFWVESPVGAKIRGSMLTAHILFTALQRLGSAVGSSAQSNKAKAEALSYLLQAGEALAPTLRDAFEAAAVSYTPRELRWLGAWLCASVGAALDSTSNLPASEYESRYRKRLFELSGLGVGAALRNRTDSSDAMLLCARALGNMVENLCKKSGIVNPLLFRTSNKGFQSACLVSTWQTWLNPSDRGVATWEQLRKHVQTSMIDPESIDRLARIVSADDIHGQIMLLISALSPIQSRSRALRQSLTISFLKQQRNFANNQPLLSLDRSGIRLLNAPETTDAVVPLWRRVEAATFGPSGADGGLALSLLLRVAKLEPVLLRQWYARQDTPIQSVVHSVVASALSPVLIAGTEQHVAKLKAPSMTVSVYPRAHKVLVTYDVDSTLLRYTLELPSGYPLETPRVFAVPAGPMGSPSMPSSSAATPSPSGFISAGMGAAGDSLAGSSGRMGDRTIDKNQYFMSALATTQPVYDVITTTRNKLLRKYEGGTECTICYSIAHATTKTMVNTTCSTCHNKFHDACLYQWFTTSGRSTCPLCRNLF